MKAHTHKGHGEAVTLKAGALRGAPVVITGAAAAAHHLESFARKAALSFVLKYDADTDKLPTPAARREECEAVYHYHCAAAFGACGIVPANRAVLWGYGAPRRSSSGIRSAGALGDGAASRLGARGLLPFAAMLAWRRALRRAANDARSLLNGRGAVFVGGDDGAAMLAKVIARGVGDGGHVQRGGMLWARGASDPADAWARSLAHAGQCLRAHWLLASGPGGHGSSREASSGMASDLALLGTLADTAAGAGLLGLEQARGAGWLGNGRACSNAASVGVGKLKRRIASGDRLLTEHPDRCAQVLGASLSAPWQSQSVADQPCDQGASNPQGARCGCYVCARLKSRAVMLRDGGEARTLAADTWRIEPVRTWADAPQGRRWWQCLTAGNRATVARLLGIAPVPAAPALANAGDWRAMLSRVVVAPAPHVAPLVVECAPMSARSARRWVHAADRYAAKAARTLAIAKAVLSRAFALAAASSDRCGKAAAAVARLSALAAKAAPSKRGAALRKVAKVRAELSKHRKAALARLGERRHAVTGIVIGSYGRDCLAARDCAASALLAAERRAADARRTQSKAARNRAARVVSSIAAAKAARDAKAAHADYVRGFVLALVAPSYSPQCAADGGAVNSGRAGALRALLARQWCERSKAAPLLLECGTVEARTWRTLARILAA